MKPRVLQFIGSFNQGGSERHAIELCRHLKEDGEFDVRAATLNYEGVLMPVVEQIGLGRIPEFKVNSFFRPASVKKVRECAEYLRSSEIDIVHTHDFYTNVFGMAAARLAGVRVRIASKRETAGMRTPAQEAVEKAAFGLAHKVVVNSDSVGEHLTGLGIDPDKLVRIYNAVDASRFSAGVGASRPIAGLNGLNGDVNARMIALVANLRHEVKNVPLLLDAAKIVNRSHPNAHFIVAGEGGLQPELRARAAALGVEKNVHFIGRCDDVPGLLDRSYAAVLTSDAEGFSNSILEYMAAGKPIVATDVGGAREAIEDGVCGFVVAPGDSRGFADRVSELLADPEKADMFGHAARSRAVNDFSVGSQLEKTKDLYLNLLGSPR